MEMLSYSKAKAQRTYNLKVRSQDGVQTNGDNYDVKFMIPPVIDNQQFKQSIINLREFSSTPTTWDSAGDRQGHGEVPRATGSIAGVQYKDKNNAVNQIEIPTGLVTGHTFTANAWNNTDSHSGQLIVPLGMYRCIAQTSSTGTGTGFCITFNVRADPVSGPGWAQVDSTIPRFRLINSS